ncbi:MAG: type II toxin-antitoxin system RelE/ParE family toxin [Rhodoferax sp.]|nr:type II toxin-antitoxin system RelE/ParE family toxin [Rhodoferax sp.]
MPPWPKSKPCSKSAAKPVQAVQWSDEATTDLVEIIDYIEQRNATAAHRLYAAIVQSAENLPLMPYLFRPGRTPGTREHVVHPNYILVYQVGTETIDILRILHSRQHYP